MGLKIYKEVDPTEAFSTEGEFSNPLTHSFDGVTGGTIEERYYVRNDESSKYYENVAVQAIDGGDNIVSGSGSTLGFGWKLIVGDQRPLEEQWGLVAAGNQISLSSIGVASAGDTTTYLPFWLRIEVPENTIVASYQGVTLKTTSTENLVT